MLAYHGALPILRARYLDTEAAGRPNPGIVAQAAHTGSRRAAPPFRRPGSPSGVTSNAPDHHAPDAGSRRAFRPPDPLLEPQDVAVHLRRPRPAPHHQPREDRAAVRRRDELHLRDRKSTRLNSSQ